MITENWIEVMAKKTQLSSILETNQYTERFGLALSEEDTELLLTERSETLKKERRVELGQSILPKLIYAFCDSDFISQDDYRDSLIRLQSIFFLYKNEMLDELTDDELISFMREQFDDVCHGDFDYLEGTCLDIFAQAVRAGYDGYKATGGSGEFSQFDITPRWDRGLYLAALNEMIT